MVDFSSSRHTARKPRTNSLFFASLCLLGVVAYALLEPTIRPSGGNTFGASLTDRAPL